MSNPESTKDLLARLNQQQAQAVALSWGPSLVIAGAGSGKTTVLTRRIAYLISHLNQDAESILAVTFTNKAAAEMKSRVEELVGADMGRRLSIGTFHSICARMLRREIEAYQTSEGWRWNSNFVIYDETDSLNLVKACVGRLNLDDKVFVPKIVRNEISSLKNDGHSSVSYSKVARTYREQRISELFSAYQMELAKNNALDFDDLIGVFTDLLKQNESVLNRQRRRFRHVLVDEFQDTNKAQYELVSLLSDPKYSSPQTDWNERSLMVVGDVDQSIYSWRKADFRIILGFQKDHKECTLIKLEENYRSTSTILDVANSIISNNSERIEKVLRCNRGKGAKAQCYEAQDEIDESYYVVEELKRLKGRGRNFSESVVLYRTNAQSRAIEEILVRNHIPYTVVGATRFYDRQEIKDVLAYLKLIYNGRDSVSFNRVINVPRRGIGKTSLERLGSYADENNLTLLEAAGQSDRLRDLPQKAAGALKEFAYLVRSWQTSAGTIDVQQRGRDEGRGGLDAMHPLGILFAQERPPVEAEPTSPKSISVSELLQRVLRETRYLEKLAEDSDKDELAYGRIENVKELVAVAQEFDEIADEPDLDSFLTRISLVSDLDAVKLDQDAVKLMTVHSAKGLEFPVVFVMGLEEGLFPHMRSLDSPTAMEEERRLMYVAVTRAADLLYLTLARKRMIIGRNPGSQSNFSTTYTIPSQFLREIAPGLLSGYYPGPTPERTAAPEYDADESQGVPSYTNNSQSGSYGQGYGAARRPDSPQSGYGGGRRQDSPQPGYANAGVGGGGYGAQGRPKPRAMRTNQPAQNGEASQPRQNIRERIDGRPPAPPDNSFEHFTVGDVVQHARFGTGKVIQVIGEQDKEIYNVEFEEAGKRLLDPRFAKLVKLP